MTRTSRQLRNDGLARRLGWASLGLGLPMLRPARFDRAIGVGTARGNRTATVAVGIRELVVGGGLLAKPHPAWLWARVGGDVMDSALLGRSLTRQRGGMSRRTTVAAAGALAIAAVDVYGAVTRSRRNDKEPGVQLTATTTINKPRQDVYEFWSKLEHLPGFMAHLDEVRITAPGRSHWRATAPFGRTVEWDAETIEDRPGERMAWRSLEGADIANRGAVDFRSAPGNQGTEIRVEMSYDIPAGKLGEMVARYFGEDPRQQLDDDLRRLKQVLETGEIVRSDGAPGGKQARKEFPQHPARPLSPAERKELVK